MLSGSQYSKGLAPAAPFSFGILRSTGCRSSGQGPAAKSQFNKSRCNFPYFSQSPFIVQDVSGVTLDNNGGAKKNIRNKKKWFVHFFIDVFHLSNVSQDAFWILLWGSGWFNASVAQLPGL
ncbi:N-acetyl-D-glucosamine kinase [Frankliniella fusca]|uniref:N-acetyl-D-glucosamine kinase n=1 Tax=Frankliniella fusca TaxID=407009 RepID=A0AAE1HKV3_9NEOP|nr:N-acetyl-D-glucosamine kinase [Frankliniella fusca]